MLELLEFAPSGTCSESPWTKKQLNWRFPRSTSAEPWVDPSHQSPTTSEAGYTSESQQRAEQGLTAILGPRTRERKLLPTLRPNQYDRMMGVGCEPAPGSFWIGNPYSPNWAPFVRF